MFTLLQDMINITFESVYNRILFIHVSAVEREFFVKMSFDSKEIFKTMCTYIIHANIYNHRYMYIYYIVM